MLAFINEGREKGFKDFYEWLKVDKTFQNLYFLVESIGD